VTGIDDGDARSAEPMPSRLPLHEEHIALGARMTDFAGWRMPVLYSSIIDEHFFVRTGAGLFDVSHMGRLLLRGPGALPTVQHLVASDVSGLAEGEARYTVLLTPWGGIQDDLICYRRDDGFLLVVNAARRADDREWINDHLAPRTELDDLTELTVLFALQGPEALGTLQDMAAVDAGSMLPFTHRVSRVAGIETTVMRTGYTGEQGVELLVAAEDARILWRALLDTDRDRRVHPCGLGARDTLRLEAALPLYGSDLTKSTTPYEAGLGWLVHLERADRGDFVGRAALLEAVEAGPRELLVGLAAQSRRIPRAGDVISLDGEEVGRITSGSLSPVLGHPIALGYVGAPHAQTGVRVAVTSGTVEIPATIADRPFYRRGVTPIPSHSERHRDSEGAQQ
jgi:aminomethyltransferase